MNAPPGLPLRMLLGAMLCAGIPAAARAAEKAGAEIAEEALPGVEKLVEDCRSADLFFRQKAEGEIRKLGPEGLPALSRFLDDPDRNLRLRLHRIFREGLRPFLEELDAGSMALLKDVRERDSLAALRSSLPQAIAKLQQEIAGIPGGGGDPEKERQAAAEKAEKAQKLRASEEALREASDERVAEIGARIQDRSARVEESRKRVLALGAAVFGDIQARREGVLIELLPVYEGLLDEIRGRLSEGDILPEPGGPEGRFERVRYLLSTVWAREIDRKGPLAERARPLLEEHLERLLADLRSGSTLDRERAEDDLYALGRRGIDLLKARASVLPPGQGERLLHLLSYRIDPRLVERTGLDLRGYRDLPFRDRRRAVIHYARVAGRDAIPTLRPIALDEKLEPSLRVRLAAAEALAGPEIRDRSALKAFERISMPELLKIPEIAREFAIINGTQLTEEKRYAEAIAEFRKVLDESPYDFQANYRIAFAYLLLRNYQKAILHFEIARRVQPGDQLTLYNLACAYSLDGQIAKALEALEASIQAGFDDYLHMERDPDLNPIRGEPKFHEIIDRLRRESEGKGSEKKAPSEDP